MREMWVKVLVAQSCPTLQPHGLYPARLLCPWNSPGKNTGVVSHSLLLLPDPGLEPGSPTFWADSLPSEPARKLRCEWRETKEKSGIKQTGPWQRGVGATKEVEHLNRYSSDFTCPQHEQTAHVSEDGLMFPLTILSSCTSHAIMPLVQTFWTKPLPCIEEVRLKNPSCYSSKQTYISEERWTKETNTHS